MDIKAELFFLVVKLLEDEGCVTAAESLKKFIDDNKLLPSRINTAGVPFDNTFDNYNSLHNLSKPSVLVEYYQLLVKLVHDRNRCASHLKTLIGIQNKFGKAFSTRCIDFHMVSKDHKRSRRSLINHLHQHSKLQFHILAHRTAIYCLEFDRRGNYVFTGSDDYTIKVWSVKGSSTPSCTLRHTLRGHVAEIIELTISIDNHLLASIDSNCCLVIWCLKTGQPVVAVRGSRNNRVLSGLAFLNVPKIVRPVNTDSSNSNDVNHPSGMLIVSSFGGYLHIIPYIHTVHHAHREDEFSNVPNHFENRWICCAVQLLPTIRFTTAPEGTPNVFWPSIACIDVSPGGLLVAAGCSDQRIRLYQFMNPLKPEPAGVLAAHEESVNSVAFSHSGLKLATGSSDGGSCWLWKFQAGQWRSMTLPFRKRVKCRPCLLVWSIHDQYLIASMKNGSVYIYFGHSGKLVTIIEGHEGAIHAVSPSPFDENILATGGVDGRFQLWNISNLRRFQQNPQHDEDNHQSIDKPLLFHYRFPPGDLDIIQGLVWRFDNPPDDQPIWSGANTTTVSRRTTRDNLQLSASDPSNHIIDLLTDNATNITFSSSNNYANNSSSHRTLTESRSQLNHTATRTSSLSNTKMQRITACRVIPTIEGVGFLVVTKSGVMSLFSPADESTTTDSSCKYDIPASSVDEQFLHWELDTAEWREVVPDPSNNNNNNNSNFNSHVLRIYENTLQALGSPPAQQSANSSSNGRVDLSRENSQNNRHRELINNHNSDNVNDNSDRIIRYRPPPAVLYEIIHAPSGVPFHRLPPGYLTNLRGFPYPSKRQLQIPGRSHLIQPTDLLPSVTLDEETGEDIVVDDIQFCSNVPIDYCPTPQLSSTQPIYGKNYLWCSPWLTNKTPLIEPLDTNELNLKVVEQQQRYEDERNFFSAGGEPVVSFGDEFNSSKHSTEQIIIMQPERNCFRQSQISCQKSSSLSSSSSSSSMHYNNESNHITTNLSPTIIFKENKEIDTSLVKNHCSNQLNNTLDELSSSSIAGPSFLHTYLRKTGDEVNSTKTLRVSTRSETVPQNKSNQVSNSILSPMDEQDDADDQDDSSEESEWSAHIDVDIGWWSRQRRRRTRRQVNTNDVLASNDTEQLSSNILNRTEMDLDNDETNEDLSSFYDAGDASLSSSHTDTNQNGPNTEGRIRRSLRQQRRLLVKRRLMREAKKAEARAARAEIEKKCSVARRSRRFLNITGDDCSRIDEDSTSRDTCIPESSNHSQSTEAITSGHIDTSSRRERLKRRLIRSLDYAVMSITNGIRTCSRLPLTRIPLDCYLSPECEGHEEELNKNHFILPNTDVNHWDGPYFDWLSTVRPSASPYLPQTGDRVVYLYRGHQDYLSKAWECGNLPLMGNLDQQKTNSPPSLPWTTWPDLPQFLCCSVQKITYHIVRIAGNYYPSNVSRSSSSSSAVHLKKMTRKYLNTKLLRQSKQLINLKDLKLSYHKECKATNITSTSSSSTTTTTTATATSSSSCNNNCPIASTSFGYGNASTSLSSDDGDSFVRLITLELQIEENQPYRNLVCGKVNTEDSKHCHYEKQQYPSNIIHVTYHDVDGILEFIILRRIFDASLTQEWKPGDLFICPVGGDSWWRGLVIQNLSDDDLSTSKPSTSLVENNNNNNTMHFLNTTYLVRWLDENEPCYGDMINSSNGNSTMNSNYSQNLLALSETNHTGSLNKLPDNIDHVNSWDMYKWYAESVDINKGSTNTADSEFTLYGGLVDGYVHISHEQICLLYGTSKYWDTTNHPTAYLAEIKRLVECITQIMQLDISEQFINPVDLAAYPDYLFINVYPVDLNFILNRLLNGYYRQSISMKSDLLQLLENTERYNLPGSSIVYNAQLVYKLGLYCIENNVNGDEVLRRYKLLISTDIPSPNLENSDQITATTSSNSFNHNLTVEKRTRTKIYHVDRREKIVNKCYSSKQRKEIHRRRSLRLNQSLSKHSYGAYLNDDDVNKNLNKLNKHRRRFQLGGGISSRKNILTSNNSVTCDSSWISDSLNLIQELFSHRRSFYFRLPIDPLEYPDYHSIIERPMDLSTIQKKLINAQSSLHSSSSPTTKYQIRSRIQQEYHPRDLLFDLNLIVANAKLYNTDPDTQVFDDTLWLENWVNDVITPCLLRFTESFDNDDTSSCTKMKLEAISHQEINHDRYSIRQSRSTRSGNTSNDEKSCIINDGTLTLSPPAATSSTTVRTSSGRVVRPPPRGSQDLCSSFSEDYSQKYNCSSEQKQSHQRRKRLISCSSGNNTHSVNKLYSRHTNRRRRRHTNQSKSIRMSNSSEDLSNTSFLRRSARKRKIVPSFSQFYGSEGNDEFD